MSSERPYTNRRTYLKVAGTAAVAAIAGCQGTDSTANANHEAPHPNDGQVPDSEVNAQSLGGQTRPDQPEYNKEAVSFSHTPTDGKYCGSCQLYVPDQNGDGFGACTEVKGKIHPCDECGRWSEYSGEPVSCDKA